MTLRRILLTVAAAAALVGVALVGQEVQPPGSRMASAAEQFLTGLKPEQRERAALAFDDPERVNYHFVPLEKDKKSTRKGLPLEAMTPEQRDQALALLRSGLSKDGYDKATTIISLEKILADVEKGRGPTRDPQWYFFTLFGTPSKTGKWGWRVEGHHLTLNFTLDGGKVVAATPAIFGANPATVLDGPRKGLRTLPESADLARELFKALDEDQKKVALQDKPFPEIEQAKVVPGVGEPTGLPAAKMTTAQKELLKKLVKAYADRLAPDVAAAELKKVDEAGFDKVHFAFQGSVAEREPFTYRVQGPTFVVEFLNVQADAAGNKANHIHSGWRNLKGDFGLAAR